MDARIVARKNDHIQLALDAGSQIPAAQGFGAWMLEHQAVPEVSLAEIDTRLTLLGKTLQRPC